MDVIERTLAKARRLPNAVQGEVVCPDINAFLLVVFNNAAQSWEKSQQSEKKQLSIIVVPCLVNGHADVGRQCVCAGDVPVQVKWRYHDH